MAKNRIFSVLREYHILEQNLIGLFEYIEPTNKNIDVYSHRLFELLLRACTAVESNLKKIYKQDGFIIPQKRNLEMPDYSKCEASHNFSDYQVKIPSWRTKENIIVPFQDWKNMTKFRSLYWYKSYNKVKHDVQSEFSRANLKNARDSIAGLFVLLYEQHKNRVFNRHQETEMSTEDSDDGFIYSGNSLFSIKKGS